MAALIYLDTQVVVWIHAAALELLSPVQIVIFPGGRRFHFRDPSGNELVVSGTHLGSGSGQSGP